TPSLKLRGSRTKGRSREIFILACRFERQQNVAWYTHQSVTGLNEERAVGCPDGEVVDGAAFAFHTVDGLEGASSVETEDRFATLRIEDFYEAVVGALNDSTINEESRGAHAVIAFTAPEMFATITGAIWLVQIRPEDVAGIHVECVQTRGFAVSRRAGRHV